MIEEGGSPVCLKWYSKEIEGMHVEKEAGPWREAWRGFSKNKVAVVGAGIVLFFILLAIFGPVIAKEGINEQVLADRLLPPSSEYWLGTDDLGRDILSRIIHGARISLSVGFFSVIGSVVVGSMLGIVAGYYGRWIDTIISRIFDIMLAFPSILLAIAIVSVLGPNLQNALIAIAIINVPNFGRLIRSKVLSIKEDEYITAAKGIGMKDARILIFPHFTELDGTRHRSRDACDCDSDFGSRRTWLSWIGRTSTSSRVGEDAGGFEELSSVSPVDNDFSRARDYVNGSRL